MRSFPWTVALLLVCAWIMSVVAFRLGLSETKHLALEMPLVTLGIIRIMRGVVIWPVTAFVLFSGVLLAMRTRLGWFLSFGACLLCVWAAVGFALPAIALHDAVSRSSGVISMATPIQVNVLTAPATLFMAASFALTLTVFGALIFGSRGLVAPRQSD